MTTRSVCGTLPQFDEIDAAAKEARVSRSAFMIGAALHMARQLREQPVATVEPAPKKAKRS